MSYESVMHASFQEIPATERILWQKYKTQITGIFQNILVFVKFLSAILGPEMAAPIWARRFF